MNKLLPMLTILIIVSCSKEITEDKLVYRSDLVYEINKDKPFDGVSKEFFYNGQLKIQVSYKKGKRHGDYKEYHSNGQLKESGLYKENKRVGLNEVYYEDGQIQIKKTFNQDGFYNGLVESFFSNGQLEFSGEYVEGIPKGTHTFFYSNGQMNGFREFKDGKVLDGKYEWFYENGSLKGIERYKNGMLDGLVEYFDLKGKTEERINYQNGKKNGLHEVYYFKNLDCLGSVKTYINDNLVTHEDYQVVNNDQCSESPTLSSKKHFKNSKEHGVNIIFSGIKPFDIHIVSCYKDGYRLEKGTESSPDGLSDTERNREIWRSFMKKNRKSILNNTYCDQYF